MTPSADRRESWLFGPFSDLFLGCGLCYVLMFAVLATAGEYARGWMPIALIPLVSLFSGAPHFGATLLRVYERADNRHRYALFAIWASLAVWFAFAVSMYVTLVGSILVTLYLTFGPWHYTGQNYGIALIFLRRRGVSIDRRLKRWIYASYVLSFVLTVIAIHGNARGADYQPFTDLGTQYRLLSLGLPQAAVDVGIAVVGVAYLVSLAVSWRALLRQASLRVLAPAALLTGSQALWFTIPLFARHVGVGASVEPLSVTHAAYAFLWVGVAHSLQYMWIASYYERRSPRARALPVYWVHCWLAGAAIWALPALVFAPAALGRLTFDGGLGLMVAVAVNIQHFILDAVIWKLRDGHIARILLRPTREADERTPTRTRESGVSWVRPLVGVAGVASMFVLVVAPLEQEFGVRRALGSGDVDRAQQAADRLRWLGRDNIGLRMRLSAERAQQGDFEAAVGHAERALALGGSWKVENNLAWLLATSPGLDPARADEAVALAERARVGAGFTDPTVLDTLAAAYANAGRMADSQRAASRAVRLALDAGQTDQAEEIARRLALYRRGEPYRTPRGATLR